MRVNEGTKTRYLLHATAYALIVMHRIKLAAKKTKVKVPKEPLSKAKRYLRRVLSKHAKRFLVGDLGYAMRATVAYALALHGERVEPLLRDAMTSARSSASSDYAPRHDGC